MTSPPPFRPDFSAPDVPLAVKIAGAANVAIWTVLGSVRAALLWLPVLVVVLAVSLIPPLRSGLPPSPFAAAVVTTPSSVVAGPASCPPPSPSS